MPWTFPKNIFSKSSQELDLPFFPHSLLHRTLQRNWSISTPFHSPGEEFFSPCLLFNTVLIKYIFSCLCWRSSSSTYCLYQYSEFLSTWRSALCLVFLSITFLGDDHGDLNVHVHLTSWGRRPSNMLTTMNF